MERRGAIAGPILHTPRLEAGAGNGSAAAGHNLDRPVPGRWQLAACIGVVLIGPTLALAARERWGTVAAIFVMLLGFASLAGLVVVAMRQREAWLQARAHRERLESARRAAMEIAAATLSVRDAHTAEHSEEVAQLCEVLCEEFEIGGEERMRVLMAAHLHDIGKIAVSREILNKPGPLDAEEWTVIKEHTVIGERILAAVPELGQAAPLVRHSHEHWDGSGYPDGLAGEEIPLGSRVVLTADAFHAIRSDRPYRKGRPPGEALAEMRAHAGTQFDPSMVEALNRNAARLRSGLGARVRISRRTMALLVGGILLLAGTALATGILSPSAPGADVRPAPPPGAAASPAAGNLAPASAGQTHRATAAPNPHRAKTRPHRPARKSSSTRHRRVSSPAATPPSRGGGPDHPTPVRAHGHPIQANGVANGRPATVVPHGNGK